MRSFSAFLCSVWLVLFLDNEAASKRCDVPQKELVGDGFCHDELKLNTAECGWDGGDCCCDTCKSDIHLCGVFTPFTCKDPKSNAKSCEDPCQNLSEFPEKVGNGVPGECYRVTTNIDAGKRMTVEAIGGVGDLYLSTDVAYPNAIELTTRIQIFAQADFSRTTFILPTYTDQYTTFIVGNSTFSDVTLHVNVTEYDSCISNIHCGQDEYCAMGAFQCWPFCELCLYFFGYFQPDVTDPNISSTDEASGKTRVDMSEMCPPCASLEDTCEAQDLKYIGDGYCDREYNTPSCRYDGGDCCELTVLKDATFVRGINGFDCRDIVHLIYGELQNIDVTSGSDDDDSLEECADVTDYYFIDSNFNITIDVPEHSCIYFVIEKLNKGSSMIFETSTTKGVPVVYYAENYISHSGNGHVIGMSTDPQTYYEYLPSSDNVSFVVIVQTYGYQGYLVDLNAKVTITVPTPLEEQSETLCGVKLTEGGAFSASFSGDYSHAGFVSDRPYYAKDGLFLFYSATKSSWCIAQKIGSQICLVFSADSSAKTPDQIPHAKQWLALSGLPEENANPAYNPSALFARTSDECLSAPWGSAATYIVVSFSIVLVILLIAMFCLKRSSETKAIVFTALFGLLNFVTDLIFVANIFELGDPLKGYLLAVFIAPVLMNLVFLFSTAQRELSKSPATHAWFKNNFVAVVILFLSSMTMNIVHLLYSGVLKYKFFNAPVEPKTKEILRQVSSMMEMIRCIPMLLMQSIIYAQMRYNNVSTLVALVITSAYFAFLVIGCLSKRKCCANSKSKE